MHARTALPESCHRLLAAQHDVISRQQLLDAGLTPTVARRLASDGGLLTMTPGVYSTHVRPDWLAHAWAGVLLGGRLSVLGTDAAAHLHGIAPAPAEICVWVGDDKQPSRRDGWIFRRGERRGRGEPSRTSVDDTLLDLAAERSDEALCALIADAVSRRLTTPAHLLASLDARPYQSKRRLLRGVLADVDAGAMSPLERAYLNDVERAHGLPRGVRQARSGRYVSDVKYKYGLLVELDGRPYHQGAKSFADMWRDNEFVLGGLPTQRFGGPHVFATPCSTARLVGRTLMSLGWPGPIMTCRRCRTMPLDLV